MLVIHGEEDAIIPVSVGEAFAEATGAQLAVLTGSGHGPQARVPVRVNHLIEAFLSGPDRRRPRKSPHPRALYVSSPIGLGHAQRDLSIVRELRARRPELEIHWLAQHPLTAVLEAAGETIHPASQGLANESAHIEMRTGEHELHVFQTIREMDEIMAANFMLFDDVVREDAYDLWIGDEAWELDFFLHENPELKTTPYVFLTDFVGWLPTDAREARHHRRLQRREHRARRRPAGTEGRGRLRRRARGSRPRQLRAGPARQSATGCRATSTSAATCCRSTPPTTPTQSELKLELGFDPERPLIVGAVGGSAVGVPLLRRIAAGFAELRRDLPEAELLLVCGPRVDPDLIEPIDGMRVVGYVHDLFRTLACCDLAIVQGGLTTTMELVANRRPFIYVPLRGHFEQNGHVAYRLKRYGAPAPTPYEQHIARRNSPHSCANDSAQHPTTYPSHQAAQQGQPS